jgi:hypothetical protein
MIPASILPADPPRSFAFPALVPPAKIPPQAPLTPDLTSITLPVTPPIPAVVQTGDVITAAHENTVTTSLSDLWQNEQALAAAMFTDPTTAKGDLIVRGASALQKLTSGSDGTILVADALQPVGVKWASIALSGAVPSTRQVIAGAGMTGGGALTADVTLTAKVLSVNGQIGAIVLTSADTASVPTTRRVIAGTGLSGGGALSADVTLTALPMGPSGASHAAGSVPDPGATAGATRYLREDATWAVPAGGTGGGMTDPTNTKGDLIVNNGSGTTRIGTGGAASNGWVLTADSTQTLGVKWAAATGGTGSQTPWTSDIDGNNKNLTNVKAITATSLNCASDASNNAPVSFYQGASLRWTTGKNNAAESTGNIGSDLQWNRYDNTGAYISTVLTLQRSTGNALFANLVGIKVGTPAYSLDIAGDCNITGSYRVNGVAIGTGGSGAQTPWASDIDAASHNLNSLGALGIGVSSSPGWQLWGISPTNFKMQVQAQGTDTVSSFALCNDAADLLMLRIFSTLNSAGASFQRQSQILSSQGLLFNAGNAERMRITAAGNIGIGTPTPQCLLDAQIPVNSAQAHAIRWGTASNTYGFLTEDPTAYFSGALALYKNGALNTFISGNGVSYLMGGNVGIGTATPPCIFSPVLSRSTAYSAGDSTTWADIVVENFQAGGGGTGTANTATGIGFNVSGYHGNPTVCAGIAAIRTIAAGDASTDLAFITRAQNITQSEKMRLTASGVLVVGGTLPWSARLTANGAATNPSNTGGAFPAIAAIGSTDVGQQIDFGIFPNSPWGGWIQARHTNANGGSWPLALNPLGGPVGVGVSNPTLPFQVNGGIAAFQTSVIATTIGMDPASGALAAGSRQMAVWYNSSLEMGVIEAIQVGQVWRNVLACPRGATMFCIGPTFYNGTVPLALCDISSDTVGDVNVLMLRSGIATMGDGPALVFGQNSGSALQCRLKSLYNTNTNGMDLAFWSYNNSTASEKLRISAAGNLGVGISTAIAANVMPAVPLDILAASGGNALRMRQSNVPGTDYFTFVVDQGSNGALRLDGYDAGTTQTGFVQKRDGRVGVKNVDPTWPLDVTGDINCTLSYRINGAPAAAITTKTLPSRALGTTYQNTTGRWMFVHVTATINANSYLQLAADNSNPPGTLLCSMTNSNTSITAVYTVSGWVAPNEFYKTITPGATLVGWVEWF